MNLSSFRRGLRETQRRVREARMVAAALQSPLRPVLAHVIPTRRCNLACAYCNEYDNFSEPVATGEMLRRIDQLAALGTLAITLSGGEPLLHPDFDEIIRRVRSHGIFAGIITNGILLTPERIRRLNRAGLDHLQISIDNVTPDETSKKSLKVLDHRLEWLAEHADFAVNINTVLGSAIKQPADALTVARRARGLGFAGTIGIIHDHSGQLLPLSQRQRKVYDGVVGLGKKSFANLSYYDHFQQNLIRGLPNDWHCRAGSRYLYICEDGLVHYCSQQRGRPGVPLSEYTKEHLERESRSVKSCAPYCTIACVHKVATIDYFREHPREALARSFPTDRGLNQPASMPLAVSALTWLFLPTRQSRSRRFLKRAVKRVLGVR